MKATPLKQKHEELSAKMVDFAGYEMPVSYKGIKAEHNTVREKVGVFDVSHMGEFFVKGPRAFELLQYATSNDVSKLVPGKAQYSCLPNEENGIVDDLIVYKMSDEEYMLVVNASNIEKDYKWISKLNENIGAEIEDQSDDYALLAVQGPKAENCLQKLTKHDLSEIKFYHFAIDEMAGIENVIISGTGYTGAGGFELYVKAGEAGKLWDAVMEAGAKFGIEPIGLGARDTLRLEMGFCLYGNDIDETTSPLEAGLGWITKLDTNFVNSDSLAKQKEEGTKRRLSAMVLTDRGIARKGYEIYNENEELIGEITSGSQSPSTGKSIALGYIQKPFNKAGNKVKVKIRNKMIGAEVVRLPFIKTT